ncbi:efflux RND transporter periplasmic adaptor subunit [Falsiroseomonas tokyonensis]|uniref:Efflux RND transporter periplasmic adaptor subunit n=1 Tax=Falsiroseomonas tokyonensis TaxID=430521 RepID=A0ABV7BNH6_9PROT|nr:efflux RND transporter periplasmic adaptor subunit [Falsiroseomonas tokyonensis]MBU8536766.1 efflux RND transporter periplasmic adaptor subunit [Falsiroseomonas tokyonensis]
MASRSLLAAAFLALGSALGAGAMYGLRPGAEAPGAATPAAAAPATPREQPPAAVQVMTLGRGEVQSVLTSIGTLRAVQSVPIASLTGGVVLAANFTEGGAVAQGTPLVEFDRRIADAQLTAAQGQLQVAQLRFERGQSLVGVRSRQQMDDDRASLQQAQSELAVRRTTLDQLTLRAPFAGFAGQRLFGVGEYVPAGKTLLWLEDRTTLRIQFRIPERFLPVLRVGQEFALEVDAVPGRRFTGRVSLIDTRPDLDERTLHLRGEVPNPGHVLPSGVFGRVRLVIEQVPDALLLPPGAVQYTLTGASVFRVKEGRAERVPVRIGLQMADRVQVLEGLAAGDTVVTEGQFNLDDGRRVNVVAQSPPVPAALGAPGR